MIDPNKPIIDVRSTVIPPTDPEDPTKPVNGGTAAPAPAPKPAPAATPAPAADGGNPPRFIYHGQDHNRYAYLVHYPRGV